MDIEPQTTEQEAEELLPLPEWLAGLNSELGSQAAGSAEQAFGMGCATSLVPGVIVLGLAFLLGIRHWVSLSLVSLVIVLLATAWAIFVAYQAHAFAMRLAWKETVRPAYEQGLELRQVSFSEAEEAARSLLPEQAPLRRGLSGLLEMINKE
jgi:hypothetical protein